MEKHANAHLQVKARLQLGGRALPGAHVAVGSVASSINKRLMN